MSDTKHVGTSRPGCELPGGDVLDWPIETISELTSRSDDEIRRAVADARLLRTDPVVLVALSTERLMAQAEAWRGFANQFDDGDFPVEEADWRQDAAYPLERFLPLMPDGLQGWIDWFRGECRDAVDDGRYGYRLFLFRD